MTTVGKCDFDSKCSGRGYCFFAAISACHGSNGDKIYLSLLIVGPPYLPIISSLNDTLSFDEVDRMLLLLARLINHHEEWRKVGSFGCRRCRLVIRLRRGNFHSDQVDKPLPNLDCSRSTACGFSGKHLPFIGFTVYRFSHRLDVRITN